MDTYLVAYDIANPKRLRKVARACEDFARLDQCSNCTRSSSLRINSVFGRPIRGIPQFYNLTKELQTHDT